MYVDDMSLSEARTHEASLADRMVRATHAFASSAEYEQLGYDLEDVRGRISELEAT